MHESVAQGLDLLIHILEICGAGFLIIGFVVATTRWFQFMRKEGQAAALSRYRQALARSILIGLEVLIAATIIKTITVEASIKSLGLLAMIVIIRTILGWTTALEAYGRWPWQKAKASPSEL